MEVVVWILTVLFVNKLNVRGEPVLHNINLTVENETHANSDTSLKFTLQTLSEFKSQRDGLGKDKKNSTDLTSWPISLQNVNHNKLELEKNYKNEAGQIEKGINISDAMANIFNQKKDTIYTSKLSTESENNFLNFQSHNLVSSQNVDLSEVRAERRDLDDVASKSWPENEMTTKHPSSLDPKLNVVFQAKHIAPQASSVLRGAQINKYDISTSSSNLIPDSLVSKELAKKQKYIEDNLNSLNRSWAENRAKTLNEYRTAIKPVASHNLPERELIEIVLEEATKSNEKIEENNLSSELFNRTKSASTQETLSEKANLFTKQNEILAIFSRPTGARELKAKEAPSEDAFVTLKPFSNFGAPHVSNVTQKEVVTFDLEGIKNKTQERTSFSFKENLSNLETNRSDADELVLRTPHNSKGLQTFNEPENELVKVALNQTQEKYLIVENFLGILNQRFLDNFQQEQNNIENENNLKNTVLAANSNAHKKQEMDLGSLILSANSSTPKSFNNFEGLRNFTEAGNEFKTQMNENGSDPVGATIFKAGDLKKKALQVSPTFAVEELTPKFSIDHEKPQDFLEPEKEINLNSVEPLVKLATTSSLNIDLTTDTWNKFEEPESEFENQQYFAESTPFSLEIEEELTVKPKTNLEEYAVKQMNFILDHLLIETQKFVAKVLQATINSVFPRDRLKQYAEGVNQVLNPVMETDYTDEIFGNIEMASQDEIYEQIIEKLNFLKNKPSKYLQKQIPPEWLNEFVDKRAELAIWVDKAAEQMHKEFNDNITEAEDPIKYQYFNETFDDISRATEIHHKLALLADLVKIIKNKKQITFMDLYMQT